MQVTKFIKAILELAGLEDDPTYKRNRLVNVGEETQMILSAAQYLDPETILNHLPFLSPDEIEEILDKLQEAEAARYEEEQAQADAEGAEQGVNNG